MCSGIVFIFLYRETSCIKINATQTFYLRNHGYHHNSDYQKYLVDFDVKVGLIKFPQFAHLI